MPPGSLIDGMQKNGIDEETARRIYNQINAFADYGFPESHAASFALIVYASAFLRHYYAPEFLAAMLNAQPMGFYSVGTLIEDARRHGVKVRPIDLTRSAWDHSLELSNGTVVVPYGGVVRTRPEVRAQSSEPPRPQAPGPRPHTIHDSRFTIHTSSHESRVTSHDNESRVTSHDNAPVVRLGLRLVRGLGPHTAQPWPMDRLPTRFRPRRRPGAVRSV
jgi:DNA polymerase III alpha subunit